MSWSVKKAGKGIDVAPQVGKAIEELLKHQRTDGEKAVIHAHGKAMTSYAEDHADETVIVCSYGHMDAQGGNAELKLEKVW